MIQPQELRIGNYLYYKVFPHAPESYKIIEVTSISKNGFISFINDDGNEETYYLDNFEKIAITEEILLKFRYKKIRDNEFLFDNHFIIFIKESKIDFYLYNSEGNDFFVCEIQFPHELQNLHYSIRKEELTFK